MFSKKVNRLRLVLSLTVVALAAAGAVHAQAPGQNQAQAEPGSGPAPVVMDTIAERAAAALEAQRLKNNPPPVAPVVAAVPAAAQGAPSAAQRAGFAPEHAVTGIRGFAGSLEASFLINGKRASGSAKYPTLVDGWKVVEITPAGSTIEKGKERKQLTFAGVVPFQQSVSSSSPFSQSPMPFGFPSSPGLPGGSVSPRTSPLPLPSAVQAR